ncbi:hypothetical protein AZF37_02240 [endosymbiont 'TC1' of Trimyema compressum]|uniref:Nif3-like dinuclear metal center hexameric protein n=1 Tax=endosymbiont 'TC1' of Trimyema compressum TaxID=243899 RepID=UPI0007F0BF5E|nr:Nif3-like dinuclear metal center hexameric protein [endosymbiont 'TC1' of Trimyema compressum]AMP20145.1 hypothetical protein AZF37_02240 [endosymbiont 'TC1' of Trimyema compressum]
MIDKNKSYKDIVGFLNQKYPIYLSEKWDNNGLFIPPDREAVTNIVVTLSLTESVIEKAIAQKANFIISHHPLTLSGLKTIDSKTREGHLLLRLIKNGIGLYVAHTNFDCHVEGLNYYIGKAIGLSKMEPLEPINKDTHLKLEFYIPKENEKTVFQALYSLGAGAFNNYDSCSFASKGFGSFRGLENSSPIGKVGELTIVNEVKVEMIIPKNKAVEIVETLKRVHPYEEVAYYLHSIIFNEKKNGLGKVGVLRKAEKLSEFMKRVKAVLGCESIEMTYPLEDIMIKRVSICGGSGKHLLPLAIKRSDIYLTGDLSYHDFEKAAYYKFPLGNIGHFHSERLGLIGWSEMLSRQLAVAVCFLEEEGMYSTVI